MFKTIQCYPSRDFIIQNFIEPLCFLELCDKIMVHLLKTVTGETESTSVTLLRANAIAFDQFSMFVSFDINSNPFMNH